MLTDRDITTRAVAQGRDPNTTKVREVMTPEVVYCFEDQDVATAAQEKGVRNKAVLQRVQR
jgi:CBS domain-containing protein